MIVECPLLSAEAGIRYTNRLITGQSSMVMKRSWHMREVLSSISQVVKACITVCHFPRLKRRAGGMALAMTALGTISGYTEEVGRVDVHEELAGFRYGISVTDLDGNVLVAHRADERFVPASNMKLFVTAAALAAEDDLSALNPAMTVISTPTISMPPTLTLVGRGDPTIGFGKGCETRCIEQLASTVAQSGLTEVSDIIGDDSWFADERRPLGWSWDDLKFGHGTSISAIAVNKNILPLKVSPSHQQGNDVKASWLGDGPSYFDLKNEAKTAKQSAPRALRLERKIGDRTARLYGELPIGSRSMTLDLAVDNPAHLAAWYFKRALEAEGVKVSGELRTQRRPLQYDDEPIPANPNDAASLSHCIPRNGVDPSGEVITSLPPASIREIVVDVNRESQNLHAEVLLRQLGRAAGTGSSFCGLLQIQKFLTDIGVPRASYDIADGSGLSHYNRATPETITTLLSYAAAAPWGEVYRASLPVGGHSIGTLRYRFRGTALEGKIFAKTGTLNHVDALSGYLEAQSGEMLAFSIIVNDRPLDSPKATSHIDAALLKIAANY